MTISQRAAAVVNQVGNLRLDANRYEDRRTLTGLIVEVIQEAVEAEREACAKLCDEIAARRALQGEVTGSVMDRSNAEQVKACAYSIRRRGTP